MVVIKGLAHKSWHMFLKLSAPCCFPLLCYDSTLNWVHHSPTLGPLLYVTSLSSILLVVPHLLLQLLPPGDSPGEEDSPVLQDQLRVPPLPQVGVCCNILS